MEPLLFGLGAVEAARAGGAGRSDSVPLGLGVVAIRVVAPGGLSKSEALAYEVADLGFERGRCLRRLTGGMEYVSLP